MKRPCSFQSVCLWSFREKLKGSLFAVGALAMVQCGRVCGMAKLPSATLHTQPRAFFPLLRPPLLSKHFIYSLILKAKNLCKQYVQNVLMNFNSYINNRWQNTKLVSLAVLMGNLHLYGSPSSPFLPFLFLFTSVLFQDPASPSSPWVAEDDLEPLILLPWFSGSWGLCGAGDQALGLVCARQALCHIPACFIFWIFHNERDLHRNRQKR